MNEATTSFSGHASPSVGAGDVPVPSTPGPLLRTGTGLALTALYGVVLGMETGGAALGMGALLVPALPLAVTTFGVPALFVGLALFDVPVHAREMAAATADAWGTLGLALFGMGPTVALYVLTVGPTGATLMHLLGLAVAGMLALGALWRSITHAAAREHASAGHVLASRVLLAGFCLFTAVFAVRFYVKTVLSAVGGAL